MSSHFPSCRFTFSSAAETSETSQSAADRHTAGSVGIFRYIFLTVVDGEAQLLYDGQVSAHPVQAVDAQACGGDDREGHAVSDKPWPRREKAANPGRTSQEEMKVKQKSREERGTVALHVVDAHPDEGGHGAVLPLTQTGQAAAKHLVWRHNKQHGCVKKVSHNNSKYACDNVLWPLRSNETNIPR